MIEAESLNKFLSVYPAAKAHSDGGFDFIYIPLLKMPEGCSPTEVEALLCPQKRDGYATRLFISQPIAGKGNNWTTHHILGRVWHSWSWQGVSPTQELTQILLGHLNAFR
jgi:hypothetical protein